MFTLLNTQRFLVAADPASMAGRDQQDFLSKGRWNLDCGKLCQVWALGFDLLAGVGRQLGQQFPAKLPFILQLRMELRRGCGHLIAFYHAGDFLLIGLNGLLLARWPAEAGKHEDDSNEQDEGAATARNFHAEKFRFALAALAAFKEGEKASHEHDDAQNKRHANDEGLHKAPPGHSNGVFTGR